MSQVPPVRNVLRLCHFYQALCCYVKKFEMCYCPDCFCLCSLWAYGRLLVHKKLTWNSKCAAALYSVALQQQHPSYPVRMSEIHHSLIIPKTTKLNINTTTTTNTNFLFVSTNCLNSLLGVGVCLITKLRNNGIRYQSVITALHRSKTLSAAEFHHFI